MASRAYRYVVSNVDGFVKILREFGVLHFILSASLVLPASLRAQTVSIPSTEQCPFPKCRVELVQRRKLVGSDLPSGGPPTSIAVDARHRTWVAYPDELIRLYAASGQFVREVGRRGGGPAEFRGPYGLTPIAGDSILAFDTETDRAIIISPSLEIGRAVRGVGFLLPVVSLRWPDSLVGSGSILSPKEAGWPLHLLSYRGPEARAIRSFGVERGTSKSIGLMDQLQRMTFGPDQALWTADFLRLRITQWARNGTMLKRLDLKPSWFATPSTDWIGNPTTPPPPRVAGITFDSTGLLYVVVQVAAADWKSAWPRMKDGAREISARQLRFD